MRRNHGLSSESTRKQACDAIVLNELNRVCVAWLLSVSFQRRSLF